MKNLKIIITIILLKILLVPTLTFGQIVQEYYFSDTVEIQEEFDEIINYLEVEDGIIMSALKVVNDAEYPLLLKIDKNGEFLWSTYNEYTVECDNLVEFHFQLFKDGYIYGISYDWDWPDTFKILWKVNPTTGELIWANQFYATYFDRLAMTECDSTSFAVAAQTDQAQLHLILMDKATGDTLKTKDYNDQEPYHLTMDNSGNLYFSIREVLKKYNAKDFDQLIWERDYLDGDYELEVISEIFIDKYDDIYLFGPTGSWNSGIIIKIDKSTGFELWNTFVMGESSLMDLAESDDFLFLTYKSHNTYASTHKYRTAKVSKISGEVVWAAIEPMTPVGNPAPGSGIQEWAFSVDIDCNEDVYLAGHYAVSAEGAGAWGVMKLNGEDGSKIYDPTITNDTSTYDILSVGKGMCVFGNTPTMVGHLQSTEESFDPVYVQLDPEDGGVIQQKIIGQSYQFQSGVIDISTQNDTIYIFKQIGKKITVEQLNETGNLVWENHFLEEHLLSGAHLNATDNFVYLTALRATPHESPPYYYDEYDKLAVYKLSKQTGDTIKTGSIFFEPDEVKLLALEADDNAAFIVYAKNGFLNYQKWDDNGFSDVYQVEPYGNNINYQGNLNIVLDQDSDSLLLVGSSGIFSIDKNTLENSQIFTFIGQNNYYDLLTIDDILYLSGSNSGDEQLVSAIDLSNMALSWEQTYNANGTFFQIEKDSLETLFLAGIKNDIPYLSSIDSFDGSLSWTVPFDSATFEGTIPFDLEVNQLKNYIAVAGARLHNDGSSDATINLFELDGDSLFSYIDYDELGKRSKANTMTVLSDSALWVGGTLNKILNPGLGFIYTISAEGSIINTNISGLPESSTIALYPNPTNGMVYIHGVEDVFSFVIYDLMGNVIRQNNSVQESQINLSQLAKGVYLIKIQTSNQSEIFRLIRN